MRILTDEDVTVRQENVQERVQVAQVGPLQPVEIDRGVSTLRLGKDTKSGLMNSIGIVFAAGDQDRTVDQHPSDRIPPPALES